MQLIQKHKIWVVVIAFLLIFYLLTRLLTLLSLPLFTDEAIYLRWAQIALHDANWRFISLTDGKQPLFIWLVIGSMRFIHDPLVAGRLVSSMAGFLTVIGLFFLGREVFKNRLIGLVSAALYVIFPFALVYDRMALYDTLVGTFIVWGLYFTFLLLRTIRLDVALIMGFITGAAVLNKTNGFFTIYLLPFAYILFDYQKKNWRERLLKLIGLSFMVVIMTYGFYSILRLSPFFYIINQKNMIFFYPIQEWLHHPFLTFFSNISAFNDWTLRYVGLPFLLLALISFFVNKKYLREKILLLVWFVVPFLGLALDGKTVYPRYIFPMTLSLLPLVAYSLVTLHKRLQRMLWIVVCILAVSYSLVTDYLILTNFANSPIPSSDKNQYLTGWPSGRGVDESTAYLLRQSQTRHIFVATEGTFGLMPYAFELAFYGNKNITTKGYWPIPKDIYPELLAKAHQQDTYIYFYQDCPDCLTDGVAPASWPLKKILQVKKVEPGIYATLYKVIPK
ncbi:hypothetical protein BH09PAT1_BH09PAT1_3600 [soil metagenome]